MSQTSIKLFFTPVSSADTGHRHRHHTAADDAGPPTEPDFTSTEDNSASIEGEDVGVDDPDNTEDGTNATEMFSPRVSSSPCNCQCCQNF